MLCAAIDIGSNTTRVLVAEPQEGQLRKVMEQRAYTQIGADTKRDGSMSKEKIAEVGEVVCTQVKLAQELGAEAIRTVATAAIRDAKNSKKAVRRLEELAGVEIEVLSEEEEGRLAFVGATKTLGHPVEGDIGVVDVGGGSSEIIIGTVADGVDWVKSFQIGSGALTDDFLTSDPPSASEIRKLRDHIDDFFDGVEVPKPDQAVAVGGSATSLRTLVGSVLEYETLERGVRVLAGDPVDDVAKRFELDPRRVRILPAGVLLLEKLSELLGQPLQIGKGGLREGIILDLLKIGQRRTGRAHRGVAARVEPIVAKPLLAVVTVFALSCATALAGGLFIGDDGVGDPYYPRMGNTGYDVQSYDVDLAYKRSGKIKAKTTIQAVADTDGGDPETGQGPFPARPRLPRADGHQDPGRWHRATGLRA